MNERQKHILEQLTDDKRINVAQLAAQFSVSPVTMRKDLDFLEGLGLVRRAHGYAMIGSRDNLNTRLAYHYEDKLRIAKLAATLVCPGETVMIESGSCCALLAAELTQLQGDVTIITNSGFIADYVRDKARAKVMLLGGEYQPEAQVTVGPLMARGLELFHVDKLFIGTDGFFPAYGFSGEDMMRVEAVKAMRQRAEKLYILTESSKFSRSGVVPLMPYEAITGVFTDARIPADAEALLLERGVAVHKS